MIGSYSLFFLFFFIFHFCFFLGSYTRVGPTSRFIYFYFLLKTKLVYCIKLTEINDPTLFLKHWGKGGSTCTPRAPHATAFLGLRLSRPRHHMATIDTWHLFEIYVPMQRKRHATSVWLPLGTCRLCCVARTMRWDGDKA